MARSVVVWLTSSTFLDHLHLKISFPFFRLVSRPLVGYGGLVGGLTVVAGLTVRMVKEEGGGQRALHFERSLAVLQMFMGS